MKSSEDLASLFYKVKDDIVQYILQVLSTTSVSEK